MDAGQNNSSDWQRPPLLGRRLIWTVLLLVLALAGLHYGSAEWDHWVRRGLGW